QLKCNHYTFILAGTNGTVNESNTSGVQNPSLQQRSDFSVHNLASTSQASTQLDDLKPIPRNIKLPSRTGLVGTQTMQNLIHRPKIDYLSSSYSSDQLMTDSGHYSPTTGFHGDASVESNGLGSERSPAYLRLHHSLLEGRQQQNYLKVNNRDLVNQFLDRYGQTLFVDSSRGQASDVCGSDSILQDASSPPTSSLDLLSLSHRTPPQSFLNLTDPHSRPTGNEFMAYTSTPVMNCRAGNDLQMLEENLASVARYVDELTDGGSGHTSRASSSARASEGNDCNNTSHINGAEVESGRTTRIEVPISTEVSPKTSSILASGTLDQPIEKVLQRASVMSDSTPNLNNTEKSSLEQAQSQSQSPFQGSLRSNSSSTTQQIAFLSSLLSQLDLSNSGISDMNSNSFNNILLSLLADTSATPALPVRPVPTNNCTAQSQSDWNSLISILRALQSTSTVAANKYLTNQMLNLQAALAALSPATLNMLAASIDNNQLNEKQALLKLLTSKSQTPTGGTSNSGLLSSIAGLLSSANVRNNSQLMDMLTSTLTALAATIDSNKSMQTNGYHSHPVTSNSPLTNYTNRGLRRSPTFGIDSPVSSLYHRRQLNEGQISHGPCCHRQGNAEGDIDRAATIYRNSANHVSQKLETIHHWTGKLPQRNYKSMSFSRKVFLGGVPWECTSEDLIGTFSQFGNVSVLWPQKDGGYVSHQHGIEGGNDRLVSTAPKGYCYLLFEHESCVADLLAACSRDPVTGGDYFKLASPKFKAKGVQVIPWVISDSQFSRGGSQARLESSNTVFVGALHGMITAEALASIMNDLFDNVIFAALDTDKHKYPIGSGRVVFSNHGSYVRAVTANFVEVRTTKFTKTLQIDPFLEDSMCNNCLASAGVYFCRAFECFRYFCPTCWQKWHNVTQSLANHKPLRRSLKLCTERI
uniref:RRM domain-containing protein n=1 Tax=Mesocestoides corti TaxID=53468 RepID=A0A5K3FDX1_MESCO